MELFISWSDIRSKKIAEILTEWIPMVIQAVNPWMSNEIGKGVRWSPEISEKLSNSKIGIICLTPENLHSDWILFEAGALSKIKDNKVCTFLYELTPADIEQPLAQFQHTVFSKDDVKKLITTINDEIERILPEKILNAIFEKNWPDLEDKIKAIPKLPKIQSKKPERPAREILEEILELTRRQSETAMKREEIMRKTAGIQIQSNPYSYEKSQKKENLKRVIKEFPVFLKVLSNFEDLLGENMTKREAINIIVKQLNSPDFAPEVPRAAIDIFLDSF